MHWPEVKTVHVKNKEQMHPFPGCQCWYSFDKTASQVPRPYWLTRYLMICFIFKPWKNVSLTCLRFFVLFLKHNKIIFEYTTKIQNTIVNRWKLNMVFHLHCMKIAKTPSYEFLETSNKDTDIPRKMKKKKKRRKWNNKVSSKD